MPVNNIIFQGINRAESHYAAVGACEELINLRPTTNGLVPVKPFAAKYSNTLVDRVYEHRVGTDANDICIRLFERTHYVTVTIKHGDTTSTLFSINIEDYPNFDLSDIHYASVGYYILFSICDKEDGYYDNKVYLWDGTEYKEKSADAPELSISFDDSDSTVDKKQSTISARNLNKTERESSVMAAYNEVMEKNKDYCFGPFLVAVSLKTEDGLEFYTGVWGVYDPVPRFISAENDLVYTPTDWATWRMQLKRDNTWKKDDGAAQTVFPGADYAFDVGLRYATDSSTADSAYYFLFAGIKCPEITISMPNSSTWDAGKSIIKSVEVYTSSPVPYINPSTLPAGYPDSGTYFRDIDDDKHIYEVFYPLKTYAEMNLGGQILYHQKSIPVADLASGPYQFYPEFGGSSLITNRTLQVDAGALTRYGEILSYNSRFHFYDSVANVSISMPSFAFDSSLQTDGQKVFVRYVDSINAEHLLYIGEEDIPYNPQDSIDVVVAPSLNITDVIAVRQYGIDTHSGEMTYSFRSFHMEKSSAYNYSICFDGGTYQIQEMPDEFQDAIDADTQTVIYNEPDAINVTEQYNPFVFKVEHSYLAPGNVLDLQPQMVAVRDVSFGDYPLNVFTDKGTYALLQGDGAVLYSNFRSISNLVSEKNSIPTEAGTFFIAAGGLWTVAGATATLVSDALHLGPHKYVRDASSYDALSGSMDDYLSDAPFADFLKGASLAYNRYRDEVIVSNEEYGYSYVLSLKYRQWFKVSVWISQDEPGDTIAVRKGQQTAYGVFNPFWMRPDTLLLTIWAGGQKYQVTVETENGDSIDDIMGRLESAMATAFPELSRLHGTSFEYEKNQYMGQYIVPVEFTFPLDAEVSSCNISTYAETETMNDVDFSLVPHKQVIDFSQEMDTLPGGGRPVIGVHLQSRPISFGYQFSHLRRAIEMVSAELTDSDYLNFAVYGSNNLRDWKLLTYAHRNADAVISQLRTSPAARSWRYYTLVVTGDVKADTDFGPFLYEYDPVIRRLG